jgi:hypothetical protein
VGRGGIPAAGSACTGRGHIPRRPPTCARALDPCQAAPRCLVSSFSGLRGVQPSKITNAAVEHASGIHLIGGSGCCRWMATRRVIRACICECSVSLEVQQAWNEEGGGIVHAKDRMRTVGRLVQTINRDSAGCGASFARLESV